MYNAKGDLRIPFKIKYWPLKQTRIRAVFGTDDLDDKTELVPCVLS